MLRDLQGFWTAKIAVTTMSGRKFNQDAGGAKKGARGGAAFIADGGRPADVLVTKTCRRLAYGP
jgi:hypothetical protein